MVLAWWWIQFDKNCGKNRKSWVTLKTKDVLHRYVILYYTILYTPETSAKHYTFTPETSAKH